MEKFVDRLFDICEGALTKTKIRQLIDQGYCTLNKKIHRIATTPCKRGDRVEILKKEPDQKIQITGKMPVVYEDHYIKVYNKPFGVESDVKKLPGLVHRLDKETSGLLIEAKNLEAKLAFEKLFKDRKVKKGYIALVHGPFLNEVTIDLPLARLGRVQGFEKFGVKKTGVEATTFIRPLKANEKFSLVECFPKTGRTHQIRVHLSAVDHPIVGDLLYSLSDQRFERMYLHAKSLEFFHPFLNQKMVIDSSIPTAFSQFFPS
ncbi:MAG: RluA family pseudouridine synthase [Chlamydiae bacterium]|nr:RluA family pseudouridine synthase [Chlamydiota bacterium]